MKRRSFIQKLLALPFIAAILPKIVIADKPFDFNSWPKSKPILGEYYKTHQNITMNNYCNHMAGKTDGSAIIEGVEYSWSNSCQQCIDEYLFMAGTKWPVKIEFLSKEKIIKKYPLPKIARKY